MGYSPGSILLHITFHAPTGRFHEGHEMKTIEETMSIIHLENNHREINTLEQIEILKVASSKYLLNDVIAGQNDPIYKLFPHQLLYSKINSPDQATK